MKGKERKLDKNGRNMKKWKNHEKSIQKWFPRWHASKIVPRRPKTFPRCPQVAPKTPLGRLRTDFGFVLGAQLGAILATFSAQDGPRGPQDASKRPSWGCFGTSWRCLGVSWRPRTNKSVSWGGLGLILQDFWGGFGRFLGGCIRSSGKWPVGCSCFLFFFFFDVSDTRRTNTSTYVKCSSSWCQKDRQKTQ